MLLVTALEVCDVVAILYSRFTDLLLASTVAAVWSTDLLLAALPV